MGRQATCYDNAVMESFFHTLKVELVHRERYSQTIFLMSIYNGLDIAYRRLLDALGFFFITDTDVSRPNQSLIDSH